MDYTEEVRLRLEVKRKLYLEHRDVVELSYQEYRLWERLTYKEFGLTETSLMLISYAFTWYLTDWAFFIPVLSSPKYLATAPLYKQFLSLLLETRFYDDDIPLSWELEACKAWSRSPPPTEETLFLPDTREEEETAHFYVDILSGHGPKRLDASFCTYCEYKTPCFLAGLGACSQGARCNVHFGVHLCKRHGLQIEDVKYCLLGTTDRFRLRDGRVLPHIGHILFVSSLSESLNFPVTVTKVQTLRPYTQSQHLEQEYGSDWKGTTYEEGQEGGEEGGTQEDPWQEGDEESDWYSPPCF